jgi:hypothetical protein
MMSYAWFNAKVCVMLVTRIARGAGEVCTGCNLVFI